MSNRLSEQQAVQLQGALSKGIDADDCESTKATRDLVQTVTVFRGPTRPSGVTVEIAERLTALLHEPIFPSNVRGVWGKIVAREVLGPTTTKTTTKTKNWPIEWPSVFCVRDAVSTSEWQYFPSAMPLTLRVIARHPTPHASCDRNQDFASC